MKIPEESTWRDTHTSHKYPKLEKNLLVDVVIVGGGITGVLTAYMLSKLRLKIALIDKGEIGGKDSVTSLTTAHITQAIDTDLSEHVSIFGQDRAKQIWNSHGEAIDLIENIIKKEEISCEFKRVSGYKYATSEDEYEALERELEIAHALGFQAHLSTYHNLKFPNQGYLEIPNQAKFHPVQFTQKLAQILEKKGVKLFQKTAAEKIHEEKGNVFIKTQKAVIKAKHVIFATYWPIHKHKDLFVKKGEYTSYVYEVHTKKASIPEGLYWDLDNPYHYVRVDSYKSHDRLLIGGEDHRVEVPIDKEKNYQALEDYIKYLLNGQKYLLVRRWTGPILETIDGLALIGKLTDRQLIATGFSGNGMTYAGIAATIFRDSIQAKKNVYIDLYNPHRILSIKQVFTKGKNYVGEFMGGAGKNVFK